MFVYAQRKGERPDCRRTRRTLRYRLHCLRDTTIWIAQNKKTIASLGDRYQGRRIRSTRSDNKFAPANQIDPFGQQVRTDDLIDSFGQLVRTSQSDRADQQDRSRSIGPLDRGYILWSLQRSDGYWTVRLRLHSSKFAKIRRLLDHYIRLHSLKFEKIGRLSDRYRRLNYWKFEKIGRLSDRYIAVTFFEVWEDRTVIGLLYTVTFFEVREDRTVIGPLY